jgi:hypothetical protein
MSYSNANTAAPSRLGRMRSKPALQGRAAMDQILGLVPQLVPAPSHREHGNDNIPRARYQASCLQTRVLDVFLYRIPIPFFLADFRSF